MPTLAAAAAHGLVFENAVATGAATFGSATSFLTGVDPVERPGVAGSGNEQRQAHVREHLAARRSVAESFADRGLRDGGLHRQPVDVAVLRLRRGLRPLRGLHGR
jgi:arylsulfatase A-like enzyme